MSRTRFIQHAGFPIVEMDFSRIRNAVDALAAIEEARLFVASQPLQAAAGSRGGQTLGPLKPGQCVDAPRTIAR